MTKEEHRKEHEKLHEALDVLIADYISHTEKRLGNSTLMELLQWSHQQTLDPIPLPDPIPTSKTSHRKVER